MHDQKKSLEERLKAHPHLSERIESILEIIEDTSDTINTADEAEERVIEELRRLGNDVLKDWAVQKEDQKVGNYIKKGGSKGHGKKK